MFGSSGLNGSTEGRKAAGSASREQSLHLETASTAAEMSNSNMMQNSGSSLGSGERNVPSSGERHTRVGQPETVGVETVVTRYVDVPLVEEETQTVKREVELRTETPKATVEEIVKEVILPRIEYVDKIVEVEFVEEERIMVPVLQVVEVPKETVRYVDGPEQIKTIEQVVEVPKIIENKVTKIVDVPQEVEIFRDTYVPVAYAQKTYDDTVVDPQDVREVEVCRYTPVLVPVDIPIEREVHCAVTAEPPQHTYRVMAESEIDPTKLAAIYNSLNRHLGAAGPYGEPLVLDQSVLQQQYQPAMTSTAIRQRGGMPPPQQNMIVAGPPRYPTGSAAVSQPTSRSAGSCKDGKRCQRCHKQVRPRSTVPAYVRL